MFWFQKSPKNFKHRLVFVDAQFSESVWLWRRKFAPKIRQNPGHLLKNGGLHAKSRTYSLGRKDL